MIGQNNFIALVRINSSANFSQNHYELLDPGLANAKLSLVENCNVVKATPIENFKGYTASEFTLHKIKTDFIGENKQFIFFIANDLTAQFKTSELYDIIDTYIMHNNLLTFWNSSKSTTFKNINYPGFSLDPLDNVGSDTTGT